MGAPSGHPFFGNQYTDGGYVRGSFSYDDAVVNTLSSGDKAATPISKPLASRQAVKSAEVASGLGLQPFSIPSLIAVGAVALIGGVATFAYLRTKSGASSVPFIGDKKIADFGLCESCGKPLAKSGPAELRRDEAGEFVVCENCSHPNRARYGEENDRGRFEPGLS